MAADHVVQERWLEGGGRDGGLLGEDNSRKKEKRGSSNGSSAD